MLIVRGIPGGANIHMDRVCDQNRRSWGVGGTVREALPSRSPQDLAETKFQISADFKEIRTGLTA